MHHDTVWTRRIEESPVEVEAIPHIEGEAAALYRDVVELVLTLITKAVDLGVREIGSLTAIGEVHSDAVS